MLHSKTSRKAKVARGEGRARKPADTHSGSSRAGTKQGAA
jgi:hypothetical protein